MKNEPAISDSGVSFSNCSGFSVIRYPFNRDFPFFLREETVEKNVDLPHTWNSADAAQGYGYYRGQGTYTKQLLVPTELNGKRLFLKFEGVQTVESFVVYKGYDLKVPYIL